MSALPARRIALVLLAGWIVVLTSSPWWLSAGNDDGFYLFQILSVVHDGRIAFPFLGVWQDVYTNLPGYPAVQGAFYAGWEALGLPFNRVTYRLFQILCVLGVLVLGVAVLRRQVMLRRHGDAPWLAPLVFLGTLGVTPFPMDALYLRPEVLGLCCVLAGLYAYTCAAEAFGAARARTWLCLGGLALGTAAATHPNVAVSVGGAGLLLLWPAFCRHKFAGLLAAIVGASVPILLVFAYFVAAGSDGLEEFWNHIGQRAPRPGAALIALFEYAIEGLRAPTPATLFRTLPYATLAAILIALIPLAVLRLVATPRAPLRAAEQATLAFLGGAGLLLALSGDGRVQVFTVVGLAATVAFAGLVAGAWLARGGSGAKVEGAVGGRP